MLIKTFAGAVQGIDAYVVSVEASIGGGNKYFTVGLPDNAVKESQFRVGAAIKNSGFSMPRGGVVVNLAPADLRKEGSGYDLPIAIALLAATGQIPGEELPELLIVGELGLDGKVLPVKGALSIAIAAADNGFKGLMLPFENAKEVSVIDDLEIYGVESLYDAVDFFQLPEHRVSVKDTPWAERPLVYDGPDFSEVKGQENIKRAMEVAATGGHNILLIGPPGSGKTMLARRLPGILPPLSMIESLETTRIHSVAGKLDEDEGLVRFRPFRNPHHTISDVALVGGGNHPQPGEISLAHNGVLFLDELPEFKRAVLEVMRQPLEERKVTISRARFSVDFPASFMLVASMNPCPCGFYNHPDRECTCSPIVVQRYLSRISGPLLDRIDIHVEVTPVLFEHLTNQSTEEPSQEVRSRVLKGRQIQNDRFVKTPDVHSNAQMSSSLLRKNCVLDTTCNAMLKNAMNKLNLSARAYDRILRVSRTIADLDKNPKIEPQHVAEAIQYRSLDKGGWG